MHRFSCALYVLGALAVIACPALKASACTVFCVVRDGKVLFCNNEDFKKTGFIWFVPAAEGRFGRVNLGFDDRFAQGSMNEMGLAFDSMALNKLPWKADPGKETPRNLIEKIMNECQTVAQALQYFDEFNCRHFDGGQFLFADATGDAAAVAWLPESSISITRIESHYVLATNTRLEASGYRCQRFVKAEQMLRGLNDCEPSDLAAVLNAVHQRGPGGFTSYSNIFDLKSKKIHLYNLANYEETVQVDLREELDKGSTKARPLTELFKSSPTLDEIRAGEQRTTWDTRIQLSDKDFDKLVGTYSPEQDSNTRFQVKRGDGVLLVENPGQPVAVLFPESRTSFRIAPDRGQVTFVFRDESDALSTGMVLHKARDLKANRVGE